MKLENMIDKNQNRTAASNLIEQIETQMGCRFDDERKDNPTMIALVGAVGRLLKDNNNTFSSRDNYAVGQYLIQHQHD